MFPGYFAVVMATGIVSTGTFLLGMKWLAWALLAINLVAYAVLWSLLTIRLIRFFPRVKADLTDHTRGPGFFTVVAGTCVLGSQWLIVAERHQEAVFLWFLGLLLWTLIMYTFFTAVTVRENKPLFETGISGTWLLAAVATQSISVLGTLLADYFGSYREPLLFLTLCMFLLGCMLYLILITLIFYRFTFVNLTTVTLTPPYWINMGAVAITTLAGARLIIAAPTWSLLGEILPFLKGFTLFFWGGRYVVDSIVVHAWYLATSSQAFSSCLRSALLGNGLSSGYVHGLHSAIIKSAGLGFSAVHPPFIHLRGPCRLANNFHRLDS